MQITPSQSVSHIAAPAGPGYDHGHGRGHTPAIAILHAGQRHADALHAIVQEDVSVVQQARHDLRARTLETEAAFDTAAEVLLTLGI